MGPNCKTESKGVDPSFILDSAGHLASQGCAGMCSVPASVSEVFVYTSDGIAIGDCESPDAHIFTKRQMPAGGWPEFIGTPTFDGFIGLDTPSTDGAFAV